MTEIGIILLAAGSSSRMGQPKQLLLVGGEPLLLRSVKAALASGVHRVFVVLGADEKPIETTIRDLPVTVVANRDWKKGMGNSLKVGLQRLLAEAPDTHAVIILVCDQPQLSGLYLRNLMARYHETKSRIVCSRYSNTTGVPALFDKSLFQKLLSLEDVQGAKKIIHQYPESTSEVDFPGGEIDLDTLNDYNAFIAKS